MKVGIVGIGFMGMIHYLAYQKVRGSKVTAIATRDAKKLAGDWRAIKGNFGPPGAKMDLGPIARHADWARPPIVLILGSLYLAGEVLRANNQPPG